MKSVIPSPTLKLALTADALVSGATAALQLAAPGGALSAWLMLPRALLVETGIFFVAYTLLLLVLARSQRVWSGLIGLIVVGNAGWALGCFALLASGLVSPSLPGTAFVLLQAAAVLVFAGWEALGLKASAPAGLSGTARA